MAQNDQFNLFLIASRYKIEKLYPYLLTIAVALTSDLNSSKSGDNTFVAKKIRAINRTMRLTFFIISRLIRFGTTNLENKF
ncbi:hypothetical protein GSB9_02573 [Flavobacteriaceae bacterium GSB9]|nr:hypothetical protein GSB9_02573 [Flavobacteriaceae bacterium GSB9]